MGMLNPWNNEDEKVRKPSPPKKKKKKKNIALYKKCGSVCYFATELGLGTLKSHLYVCTVKKPKCFQNNFRIFRETEFDA